jgi:hypothetical protein
MSFAAGGLDDAEVHQAWRQGFSSEKIPLGPRRPGRYATPFLLGNSVQ